MINKNKNDEGLLLRLDLLEERRELAAIAEEKHKRKLEKYYNSKVRGTILKPRDLVYRSNEASKKEDTGKLGPKWEGPYEVTEALGDGAYKLRDQEGTKLPKTWNTVDLKSRRHGSFCNMEATPHALAMPWRRQGVPFRTLNVEMSNPIIDSDGDRQRPTP
ncbi:hypothetical protein Tco_0392888 [Tanacetum coccineum]